MSSPRVRSRPKLLAAATAAIAVGGLGTAALVTTIVASDHQDTVLVERNPRRDINDVYVFPAATLGRVVLAVTTQSPLTPAATSTARFDTNVLHQIKIDNNGDGLEDLVYQVTFANRDGGGPQMVEVRGPVAPASTGPRNRLVSAAPAVTGPINTVLGRTEGLQVFAGPRADPFFIDLEQFFRILPDRRPAGGPLSQVPETPTATSFRNPGVNFLVGINAMTIVLEMPKSFLGAAPGGAVGVWATTSVAE
jgi:hypothetical protein